MGRIARDHRFHEGRATIATSVVTIPAGRTDPTAAFGRRPANRKPRLGGIAEDGWEEVARDPEAFLGLGLCSRGWLSGALPTLLDAADRRLVDGRALCHLDVRSDNLCFRANGEAVLVDWDCASNSPS